MARKIKQEKLGEILERDGIITRDQVEQALALQKESGCMFGEALVELGFATEEDIAISLVNQLGCPFLRCSQYEYESNNDLLDLFSDDVLRENAFMPVDQIGNTVIVISAGPLSPEIETKIINLTGCDVTLFISTPTDIRDAIDNYMFKKEKKDERKKG
ncbi:MAG: hypothetical protein ABIF71_10420 [Planctomycetota bacterium]